MNIYAERFHDAMNAYLSDTAHTGKSEQTVHNYHKRLKYFEDFWAQGNPTSDPDRQDLRQWRDALLDKGVSPRTVKQYLIEVSAFFNFCVDEKIYQENPVNSRLLPTTKGEDKKPYDKILTVSDIMMLWESTPHYPTPFWYRNYAIVQLLLDGKLRNSELLHLTLDDIDFTYKEVVVRKGKGNKYRIVSVHDIALTAVLLYLNSMSRPKMLPSSAPLFGTTDSLGEFGRRSAGSAEWHCGSTQWLSSLVERHVRLVTGKEGFRTHSLRHNGSMLDLNNGVSLERLQSELGHSSVQTTEIYAGKLGSRRHQDGYRTAITKRDYWAEKNMELLRQSDRSNCVFDAAMSAFGL